MRSQLLLVYAIAAIAVAGCEDAIGPGGSCRSEMNDVRRQRGQPDDRQASSQAGDFMEQWRYDPRGGLSGRVYTFRWGVSYEGCRVSDGPLFSLAPEAGSLPARVVRSDD